MKLIEESKQMCNWLLLRAVVIIVNFTNYTVLVLFT